MSSQKSPGTRLREAREAQGKTIMDMAKVTRIGMKQLEGIEEDNYDRIPAEVYVKGFVKNYAQALGLDPIAIVEQVEKILKGDDGTEEKEVTTEPTVPKPMAEDEPASVVTEPLQPSLFKQTKDAIPDVFFEKVKQLKSGLSSIQIPVDRRLGLIVGVVVLVLVLVFGLRGCRGGEQSAEASEDAIPVERLENLLIATPEPILFELPRTTP